MGRVDCTILPLTAISFVPRSFEFELPLTLLLLAFGFKPLSSPQHPIHTPRREGCQKRLHHRVFHRDAPKDTTELFRDALRRCARAQIEDTSTLTVCAATVAHPHLFPTMPTTHETTQ